MPPNSSAVAADSVERRFEDRGRTVFTFVGILLILYLSTFKVLKETYHGEYVDKIDHVLDSLVLNVSIFSIGLLWWFFEPITSLWKLSSCVCRSFCAPITASKKAARSVSQCLQRVRCLRASGGAGSQPLLSGPDTPVAAPAPAAEDTGRCPSPEGKDSARCRRCLQYKKHFAVTALVLCIIVTGVVEMLSDKEDFCKARAVEKGREAVKVLQNGNDPNEGNGSLVFFVSQLQNGSIEHSPSPKLGKYFDLPTDFEIPALSVESEVKECIELNNGTYAVRWQSSHVSSHEFEHGMSKINWTMACGTKNIWDPSLPKNGTYYADTAKVGAFTISNELLRDIELSNLLASSSMLTDKGVEADFFSGPDNCGPGISFCQNWSGHKNKNPNDIGEARVIIKSFDWNNNITVVGLNMNGVILDWTAPLSWPCQRSEPSRIRTVRIGTPSKDEVFEDILKDTPPFWTTIRICRTWIILISFLLLAFICRVDRYLSWAPNKTAVVNSSVCNYLMYLQVNMYIFFILSIVNAILVFFFASRTSMFSGVMPPSIIEGIGGNADTEGADPDLATRELSIQLAKWVIDGIVILAGLRLIKASTAHQVLDSQDRDRMKRTVWMQAIPSRDRQTGDDFLLDKEHFKEVSFALTRSINEQCTPDYRRRPHWTRAERDDAIQELRHRGYEVSSGFPSGQDELLGRSATWNPTPEDDSSVVEACQVVPVLDEWERVQLKHQRVEEKVNEVTKQIADIEGELPNLEQVTTLLGRCHRCRKRSKRERYMRRQRSLKQKQEALQKSLEKLSGYPKKLSGSAFVTFRYQEDCDRILSAHCLGWRKCSCASFSRILVDSVVRPQGYSYFHFGRPPFGSVTLRCLLAPPPSDIEWKNLHVKEFRSRVLMVCLGSFFLIVFFVLMLPLLVPILTGSLSSAVEKEAEVLRNFTETLDLSDETKHQVINIIEIASLPMVQLISSQLPTILLTIISSGLLPCAIELIGLAGKARQKSAFEVSQLSMNYYFIVFNIVLLPILGMSALEVGKGIMEKKLKEFVDQLPTLITNLEPLNDLGPYGMRYLMNAAFLSSITQLLNVAQTTGKIFERPFVQTESDRQELKVPYPWPWGYWYGWTLSIFTLTTIVGAFTPSVYPMAAVFFYLKFLVDRHNLVNKVYDPATEMGGRLVITAVRDMRYVVAFCWLVEGIIIVVSQVQEWPFTNSFSKKMAYLAGIILITMGVIVSAWATLHFSSVLMSLSTQNLKDDLEREWKHFIRICFCCRRCRTKSLHERFGFWLGLPTLVSQESDPETTRTDLTWDGARLLKLE